MQHTSLNALVSCFTLCLSIYFCNAQFEKLKNNNTYYTGMYNSIQQYTCIIFCIAKLLWWKKAILNMLRVDKRKGLPWQQYWHNRANNWNLQKVSKLRRISCTVQHHWYGFCTGCGQTKNLTLYNENIPKLLPLPRS